MRAALRGEKFPPGAPRAPVCSIRSRARPRQNASRGLAVHRPLRPITRVQMRDRKTPPADGAIARTTLSRWGLRQIRARRRPFACAERNVAAIAARLGVLLNEALSTAAGPQPDLSHSVARVHAAGQSINTEPPGSSCQ